MVAGATPIGVSVGLSTTHDADDVMELLERADRALYAAKPGGRRAR
jgi:PleD family two-component response regulator